MSTDDIGIRILSIKLVSNTIPPMPEQPKDGIMKRLRIIKFDVPFTDKCFECDKYFKLKDILTIDDYKYCKNCVDKNLDLKQCDDCNNFTVTEENCDCSKISCNGCRYNDNHGGYYCKTCGQLFY